MQPDDTPRGAAAGAPRLDRLRELSDDEPGAWLARDRIGGATLEVRTFRVPDHEPGGPAVEAAVARVERIAAALADVDDARVLRPVVAWRADDDGAVSVASMHVPAVRLREALRGAGGLDPARAAVVLGDVARALAAAHARGVVHGDVRADHVRLADDGSGVARLGGFERRTVLGDAGLADTSPPAYQSPEQLDGHRADARSDVYALGLLGWELLAGRRPWSGEQATAVVEKQRLDALPALAVLRPDAPRGLVAAVERALLKDPARRWPDAATFVEAMERVRGAPRPPARAAADAPPAPAPAPDATPAARAAPPPPAAAPPAPPVERRAAGAPAVAPVVAPVVTPAAGARADAHGPAERVAPEPPRARAATAPDASVADAPAARPVGRDAGPERGGPAAVQPAGARAAAVPPAPPARSQDERAAGAAAGAGAAGVARPARSFLDVPPQRRRQLVVAGLVLLVAGSASAVALRESRRAERDARWLDSLQRGVSTGELFDTAPGPDGEPRVVRRPRPARRAVAPPRPDSVPAPAAAPAAPAAPSPAAPQAPAPAEEEAPPLLADPPRARVRLPGDTARPDTAAPPPAAPEGAPPAAPPPPAAR